MIFSSTKALKGRPNDRLHPRLLFISIESIELSILVQQECQKLPVVGKLHLLSNCVALLSLLVKETSYF
jgi:hypothetical protein